jgi:hypothetical protein
MAIRDFWGFDNIPPYTAGATALNYLRGDIVVTNYYTNYGTVIKGTGSWANWLTCIGATNPYPNTNYGTYNPLISIPYQNLSVFSAPRSFIGMRFQVNNNSLSVPVLYLQNTAGTKQTLVLNTQLALNTPQYIEVMIDRANTQIVVWIDGVQVSSTFFDFNAFVSADGNASLVWGCNNSSANYTWYLRDVYFLDDTQDATQCNRLGPVDVTPAALASVTAPNWTSSDSSTALVDLSTPLGTTAGSQNAPLLTEPATMDPLQFKLSNAGLIAGESILAAKADVSGQRTASYIFAPQASVSYNGQSVNGKQITYPNGAQMYWNQNAFVLEKAPDGTPFTPQSLAAMVATLTP